MTIVWCDYGFVVCLPEADWNEVPGLYVFARPEPERWEALYVGQTDNLRKRLGATHIHARVERNGSRRRAIEKHLIQELQPPMNVLGL